ncbi:MAG: hypothetical protein BWY04_01378 [candidate division CPR1 bacterium ADurb.Bin160]|uniref:Uncharacterized protein n=1 Tax=candidate division CPR1 bacterium ADurb.Bin160 TaxID=1852826 RepID=A0A1V5ZJN5_9BACT|nr:MAG: hypothetical protein BWY04_01378 [candidate division CPR1 bacterium ADurb.Bin160]
MNELTKAEIKLVFAKGAKMIVQEAVNLCYRNRGKSLTEISSEYKFMSKEFFHSKGSSERITIIIHLYSYLISMFYITNCKAITEDDYLFFKHRYVYSIFYDLKNKIFFNKKRKYMNKMRKMFDKEDKNIIKESIKEYLRELEYDR